jgi:NADH:ubiquinone oxidoreductase subunit E
MSNTQNLIKSLVEKHGNSRCSLMPVLQGVVQEERYLSENAMLTIAKELNLSTAEVYGTATFYTFLNTVPKGKNIVRVCKTISCHMQDKNAIVEELENILKVKVGETTHDKKFTLLETNCLGWCHKGPVVLINDDIYTEVTPQGISEIIWSYSRKS